MSVFRLLHIADLHVASRPHLIGPNDLVHVRPAEWAKLGIASSHSLDVIEELCSVVLARDDLDAILITGDVAATGAAPDLNAALRYVRMLERAAPVRVVPGNHDRFRALYAPGGREFDALFGWTVGQQQADLLCVLEKQGVRLAIVGADLSLPATDRNVVRWPGEGVVSDAAIASLAECTRDARARDGATAVVWAIHFAPEFPNLGRGLKLRDDRKLITAAVAADVSVVLVGHTHIAATYRRRGIDVLCAGSATQHVCPAGNAIHLCDIDVSAAAVQVRRVDFLWDEATATFQ